MVSISYILEVWYKSDGHGGNNMFESKNLERQFRLDKLIQCIKQ
jgi:hypothetical protein